VAPIERLSVSYRLATELHGEGGHNVDVECRQALEPWG
jgi:hypothetical protein